MGAVKKLRYKLSLRTVWKLQDRRDTRRNRRINFDADSVRRLRLFTLFPAKLRNLAYTDKISTSEGLDYLELYNLTKVYVRTILI